MKLTLLAPISRFNRGKWRGTGRYNKVKRQRRSDRVQITRIAIGGDIVAQCEICQPWC